MKRRCILLFFALAFCGCETADYYTNPNSQGYREQGLGAICEQCGREFRVSAYQINNFENVTCPYDGHAQNTKFAYNRYVYAFQKQQQGANQTFGQMRQEYLQERQAVLQKASDERIKSLLEKSPTRQNVQVQPAVNSPTHTDCTPNLSGGFNCKSW